MSHICTYIVIVSFKWIKSLVAIKLYSYYPSDINIRYIHQNRTVLSMVQKHKGGEREVFLSKGKRVFLSLIQIQRITIYISPSTYFEWKFHSLICHYILTHNISAKRRMHFSKRYALQEVSFINPALQCTVVERRWFLF